MKKFIIILMVLSLTSCGDENDSASTPLTSPDREKEPLAEQPSGDDFLYENETKERAQKSEKEAKEVTVILPGRYRKTGAEEGTTDCNCECIDVSFDEETEWCIVRDKVYISARGIKTGENTVDIFFTRVSREENMERPLPWDKFDTDTPIAQVEFQPDGTAELDWLGFSIDGKLAHNYAIYGKKTLEGTYKKD